ncbi:hypothetical protein [Mycolicibacterium mageritense]
MSEDVRALRRLQKELIDRMDALPLNEVNASQLRVLVALFDLFGAGNKDATVLQLVPAGER